MVENYDTYFLLMEFGKVSSDLPIQYKKPMNVYFESLRINGKSYEKIRDESDENLVVSGGNCNLYVS